MCRIYLHLGCNQLKAPDITLHYSGCKKHKEPKFVLSIEAISEIRQKTQQFLLSGDNTLIKILRTLHSVYADKSL